MEIATKKFKWFEYSFLVTNEHELIKSFKHKVIIGTGSIHFTNVYTLYCADKEASLKKILSSEELISDGVPITFFLRNISKKPFKQIRGPSFMKEALLNCDADVRHFLLGSTEENLGILQRNFTNVRPELQIVGTLAPVNFDSTGEEVLKWIKTISDSSPDVVWVGLGTPKQDYAISVLSNQIKSNFVGVGAAFDFLAGTKNEAPEWVRKFAMEWLFRFFQEPKRLWRRYLKGNTHFIAHYALPTLRDLWILRIFNR
jgi:N-acetylglucosaminyldiphosphoundecaprenol N-acetyl-beta-D-mannosaminyltransferase